MADKTRLERLAKKDRDHLSVLMTDVYRWPINTPLKYVEESLTRLRVGREALESGPNREGFAINSIESFAASTFSTLDNALTQRAIIDRLRENSARDLILGFHLAERFGFVSDLAKTPEHSGGHDCLHVFNVLAALSVNDQRVVSAYLARHSNQARKGHPFTVSLFCSAMQCLPLYNAT